jgi:hypothetical protein
LKARFNGIDLEETRALKEGILTRSLIEAGRNQQVRKSALEDFLGRARQVFKLVNGVPTAFELDGKTVRYGKDGVSPMSLEEWTVAQAQEAPHLFEASVGGGAPGSLQTATGGAGENPWKRETFNLTKQGQILKRDPALARALMAAAK